MLRFDPALLADEFDPAIVTNFEYESVSDESIANRFIYGYGQYYDLFNAYDYAKNEILPLIREKGRDIITPKLLLHWLNQGHLRIAASLSKVNDIKAGEYCPLEVMQWSWGVHVQSDVERLIGGESGHEENILKIAKQNHVPEQKAREIIRVILKIRDLPSLQKKIEGIVPNFMTAIPEAIGENKLFFASRGNYLSVNDKETLSELVVVGMDPADKPAAMEKFALRFANKWKACDPKNDDQVAELALIAFQDLIRIHAYGVCNKRLTTWLVQTVIRSLNRPCFMMRDPLDRQDSKCSYNDALSAINRNPDMFKAHVLNRIKIAETQGYYISKSYYELSILRHEVYVQLLKYQAAIPADKLKMIIYNLFSAVQDRLENQYGIDQVLANTPSIQAITLTQQRDNLIRLYDSVIERIASETPKAKSETISVSKVTSAAVQYTSDEINQIKQTLEAITGKGNWAHYSKGTSMMLNLANSEEGNIVMEKLSQFKGYKAVLGRVKGIDVIQLSNINLRVLRESTAELMRISISKTTVANKK